MRIIIDIDGTICEIRKTGQTYSDVRPNPLAIQKIQELKEAGHYIILQTARHMKTCNGDKDLVIKKVGQTTQQWLSTHKIPYDEIHFGKPYGDVYIDDLGHTFIGWDSIHPHHFDDEMVNILIPMAGRGSRFQEAGFSQPKPLIDVLGKPMIQWALQSFDFIHKIPSYRYIFIILKEHEDVYHMSAKLHSLYPESAIKIVVIDKVTRGQAETCLAAKNIINTHNKLFIYNCDTYSTSNIWDVIEEENPDGILSCFKANDSKYSYAKIDTLGYVTKTAEKNQISDLACNGLYYFRRGLDFVRIAEEMIAQNEHENNEFYVAPCYNNLIRLGKKIRIAMTDKNHVLGTPDELRAFIDLYKRS